MTSQAEQPEFAGLSVFVMEDESLLLVNLEDMLGELGCTIVGPAMRIEQAEKLLAQEFAADVAILDVNIGGKPVFPIAIRLADMGIPIVFATGYGRDGLPAEWQNAIILSKPYTYEDVTGALRAARR